MCKMSNCYSDFIPKILMLRSSRFDYQLQFLVSMLLLGSLAAFRSAALCFCWCLERAIDSVVELMLNFGFCQCTVNDVTLMSNIEQSRLHYKQT